MNRAREDYKIAKDDPHPFPKRRENEILLRNENVVKALGCDSPSEKACEHRVAKKEPNGGKGDSAAH